MIAELVERWIARRRVRRILKACGCVCYCPRCRDPLNDSAYVLPAEEDNLLRYECRKCGKRSAWNFDYPVPILVEEKP